MMGGCPYFLQGEDGMGEVQAEARMARGELQPGQPEVTEELERP